MRALPARARLAPGGDRHARAPPELAAAHGARRHHPGAPRRLRSGAARWGAVCGGLARRAAQRAVLRRGAPPRHSRSSGDIELFARAAQAPVVGITGTNGKSTVTSAARRAWRSAPGCKVRAGGNLGPPALDLLDGRHRAVRARAVELPARDHAHRSSCRAATVLNVTPGPPRPLRLARELRAAKARIFARCDTAVINLDDPLVVAMPRAARRTLRFSLRASIGADYARGDARGRLVADARRRAAAATGRS